MYNYIKFLLIISLLSLFSPVFAIYLPPGFEWLIETPENHCITENGEDGLIHGKSCYKATHWTEKSIDVNLDITLLDTIVLDADGYLRFDRLFDLIDVGIPLLDTVNRKLASNDVTLILKHLARILKKSDRMLTKITKVFPDDLYDVKDMITKITDVLGDTIVDELANLTNKFFDKIHLDERINEIIENIESRAYDFLSEIEDVGNKIIEETLEDVNALIDDKLAMVMGLTDELMGFVNETVGKLEDIVDDALDRVENIVGDIMTTMDTVMDDVERMEDKLIGALWNMIYKVECIQKTTLNQLELLVGKIFSTLGLANYNEHPCLSMKGYTILDDLFSTHDVLKLYAVSECLVFFELNEDSAMREYLRAYAVMQNNIKLFKCYSDGKLFKKFFVKQEQNIDNILNIISFYGVDNLDDLMELYGPHTLSGYETEDDSILVKFYNLAENTKNEVSALISVVIAFVVIAVILLVIAFCCKKTKRFKKFREWMGHKFVETGTKNFIMKRYEGSSVEDFVAKRSRGLSRKMRTMHALRKLPEPETRRIKRMIDQQRKLEKKRHSKKIKKQKKNVKGESHSLHEREDSFEMDEIQIDA